MDTVHEFIKITPSVLWFFLVLFVFWLFRRQIRALLPNLAGFKAMGVELAFHRFEESLGKAVHQWGGAEGSTVEIAEKSPQWKVDIPPEDKERVVNRARENLSIFRDALLLWVDDHPANNRNERRMFRHLGVRATNVTNTKEAIAELRVDDYDLVISDIARGAEATAGLQLLEELRQEGSPPPVVLYVGNFDPERGVPSGAFGITNRPDELLNLAIDALDRRR